MGSSSAAAAEASADLGAKMSSKSHVILSLERFNCEKELNGDCFRVVCFADISKKRPFDLDGGGEEIPLKKQATEAIHMDGKDPKSIAMQVAASLAQRAGLGSLMSEDMRIPNKFVGLSMYFAGQLLHLTVIGLSTITPVIGRGGEQINKLQSETGAKIQVAPDPPPGQSPPDRLVSINGTAQAVEKARNLLNRICVEGKIPESLMSLPVVAPGEQVIEMMIPASKVGLIIGKGGETIKALQERAQCRMMMVQDGPFLNAPEKPLRIMGDSMRAQRGKDLVQDLLTEKELEQNTGLDYKGNRHDMARNQPGMQQLEVPVPRDIVGFVIGKSGETIKRIQAETGARVQFNMKDNSNAPDRMASVQVSAARRSTPQGPPANMPGINSVEYPVPGNKCGLVIGKGGETIRGIIKVCGAHVELNRAIPESSPTKCFIIRGPAAGQQAGQGQGQPDYSAAWATYYQQLYQQQQAAAATGQGAPGQPAGQAGQPDYSQAWADYYRQQGYYYPYQQQQQPGQPQQPGVPGQQPQPQQQVAPGGQPGGHPGGQQGQQ
ncbi:Far upstream element-binding protein 3 [Desmophyllum pertusum]|uniref:Far upstream element-binding protein 3 n=1 Tax=Desmophyllum pertusum TaxID=174260 RepID=A0A9W9YWQ0_9CNID|nr:Far upstream element-binding protein 3 [Desmophyllum pertusum]